MCATERRSGGELPAGVPRAIRASGLVDQGDRGVVLLSGGPDSVCLIAGLTAVLDPGCLTAVHLNYGLRPESGHDQEVCERLCDRLGVELIVERPPEREGNLQDWARRARYGTAERVRADRGADWIAVGHTAGDLAETVIYRLASSPGVRPLLGMRARRGKVIRPLLALSRDETKEAAVAAGLEFADDRSNEDPAYARSRIRHEFLPLLEEINPAAEANIGATAMELLEDDDLLGNLAATTLEESLRAPGRDSAPDPGREALPAAALIGIHPALRRRVLRAFAESALDRNVAVTTSLTDQTLRLARNPEGGLVDLGSGATFVIESGWISVSASASETSAGGAIELAIPGEAEWGAWTLRVEPLQPPFSPAGPGVATIDRDALGAGLRVRGWRQGDRIRPLGLDGSKSLQDLFTDASIPRSLRRELPLVLDGEEVVWVAGVALSHRVRLRAETAAAVRISARRRSDRDRDSDQAGRGPGRDT